MREMRCYRLKLIARRLLVAARRQQHTRTTIIYVHAVMHRGKGRHGAQSPWSKLHMHRPPTHKRDLPARPLGHSPVRHALHKLLLRLKRTCNTWAPARSWWGHRTTIPPTKHNQGTSKPGWSLHLHESASECRHVTCVCLSPCSGAVKPQARPHRHHRKRRHKHRRIRALTRKHHVAMPLRLHDWRAMQPHASPHPYLAAPPRTPPPTMGNNSNDILFRQLPPTHACRTCSGTCRRGLAATL